MMHPRPWELGEGAVGWKVKVFWPNMGRYYSGVLVEYKGGAEEHLSDGGAAVHELPQRARGPDLQ